MHGLERIPEDTFFARASEVILYEGAQFEDIESTRKDRDVDHAGTSFRNEWSFHGIHA